MRFYGDLFPHLIADGFHIPGDEIIPGTVLRHERVDVRLRYGVHFLHQIAHRPCVHLPPELGLSLYPVSLHDGNLAHIVSEAHDFQRSGDRRADGGTHPVSQTSLHIGILSVSCHDLPGNAKPRPDEPVFPVTVGAYDGGGGVFRCGGLGDEKLEVKIFHRVVGEVDLDAFAVGFISLQFLLSNLKSQKAMASANGECGKSYPAETNPF